jgi:purine nucleosidase
MFFMDTPKRRRVVLDTDTYNEIDDQFALAHLLLSPDVVDLEAIYAAPFFNTRSEGPGDGMEKSYEEIKRVLDLIPTANPPPVFRGSTSFLPGAFTPVDSEAVRDLIKRALLPDREILNVVAIGAITNVASALLLEPAIAPKIKIIWLGGHAPYWKHTQEFNLKQDIHASRIVLDREVPLILVPCNPVSSHLLVTMAELDKHLAPFSKLGKFLTEITRDYIRDIDAYINHPERYSKVIWDIAATAFVINPKWLPREKTSSPILNDDLTWTRDASRREISVAVQVNRDAIFSDLYKKIAAQPN